MDAECHSEAPSRGSPCPLEILAHRHFADGEEGHGAVNVRGRPVESNRHRNAGDRPEVVEIPRPIPNFKRVEFARRAGARARGIRLSLFQSKAESSADTRSDLYEVRILHSEAFYPNDSEIGRAHV